MPAASTVRPVRTLQEASPEDALIKYIRYALALSGNAKNVLKEHIPGAMPSSHLEIWHGNRCPAPALGLCSHCYLGKGNQGDSTAQLRSPPVGYLDAFKHVAAQGNFVSAPMVGIEPGTSPWTQSLMSGVLESGLIPALTTSGIGWNERKIAELAAVGCDTLCFSYDASATGHGTRDDKPAHMQQHLIPLTRAQGMEAVGMVTVMPNAEPMVETVRYLTDAGCSMVSFHPVECFGVEPQDTDLFTTHRDQVRSEVDALLQAAVAGTLAGSVVHLEAGAMEIWFILDSMDQFKAHEFKLVTEIGTDKPYLSMCAGECEIILNLSLLRGTENIRLLHTDSGTTVTTCRAVCRARPPVPWDVWQGDLQQLARCEEWIDLIQMELDELTIGLRRCAQPHESAQDVLLRFVADVIQLLD